MTEHEAVEALTRWFERNARDLPWRRTGDPYAIWISEVMLQQTQVATVIPYYEKFLGRFPTVERLAEAPEPEVMRLWAGLGYYSRARNLRKGARHLLATHDGRFPRSKEALLETPGIGPYTAGAILSIAYDLPAAIVDGNVQRVFARYLGEERPIEERATQRLFWETAERWVALARSPRLFNQSLMELGATVCTKGAPRCEECPITAGCAARQAGNQASLPTRRPKRASVDLTWLGLVFEHEGRLFARQNPSGEWWAGLWDFPRLSLRGPDEAPRRLSSLLESHPEIDQALPLAPQKHTVTHHKIRLLPFLCRVEKRLKYGEGRGKWWTARELREAPVSSLVKKVLRASW